MPAAHLASMRNTSCLIWLALMQESSEDTTYQVDELVPLVSEQLTGGLLSSPLSILI